MSLFSKRSPSSTELIFDIESDSVCAIVVRYEAGKTPNIIYHIESQVLRKAHTDGAYLTRNMLKALDESAITTQKVMHDLLDKKLIDRARVDKIHVVLSSPWIISRLSCINRAFEKETTIKRSAVADLLEKERAVSSRMFAVGDNAAIDAKLFEVKINGYPVADYEDKKAMSLEGTMAVSFASRKILDDIKSRINRVFRAGDENFHSAPILRYIALRGAVPRHADYIWLQIHGELTDVLIVRQESCAISGSLPFGSDTLLRKFAISSKESESAAVSSLALLDNGDNTGQMADASRAVLEKILREWTRGMIDLAFGGKESALPAVAYVSAGRFASAFESALKKLSPTISIRCAGAEMMAPFVEYSPSVSADISASMYAVALSLSKEL